MENFELVEKIVEKTGVSYEAAKAALEQAGGDILDAMIILEKQRKAEEKAEAFTAGSTEGTGADETVREEAGETVTRRADFEDRKAEYEAAREERRKERQTGWNNFKAEVKRLFELSVRNTFQVRRKGDVLIAIPTLALIALLIFAFWFTVVLMVVGLFFGCRYSFEAKSKTAETVNEFLGKAADAAETIKKDLTQDKAE